MGTPAKSAAGALSVPYVARQPILDAKEKVLGYELVFQPSSPGQNSSSHLEGEICAIIDTLNVIGLGVLCDGRGAFIDFTYPMLLAEYFALLPPGMVIEIQDSV